MIRLFTGIAIPAPVREVLLRHCSGLPGARWRKEEQFHLTLRFIGEVDERRADDIVSALAAIRAPAFSLSVSEVGMFGEKRRPRILWAGVRGEPALARLRAKGEAALARVGLPPENRKFHPHITLAMLDRQVPAARLGEYLSHHNGLWAPPFAVDRFHLYSSTLAQSGAIYTIEESFPLQGGMDLPENETEDAPALAGY